MMSGDIWNVDTTLGIKKYVGHPYLCAKLRKVVGGEYKTRNTGYIMGRLKELEDIGKCHMNPWKSELKS